MESVYHNLLYSISCLSKPRCRPTKLVQNVMWGEAGAAMSMAAVPAVPLARIRALAEVTRASLPEER